MYTKAKIFNLALGALLLNREIADTETDQSNENEVLNTHWETALRSTLEDLDLDSTSTPVVLSLIEEDPTEKWLYAYAYPNAALFVRRIENSSLVDNRSTRVPLRIALHEGQKVIFCNIEDASAEIVTKDVPLTSLASNVGMAIAYKLAMLSAPLIVGKGAQKLRKEITEMYAFYKTEAQELDSRENFNFNDPEIDSEFVEERLS